MTSDMESAKFHKLKRRAYPNPSLPLGVALAAKSYIGITANAPVIPFVSK